MENVQENCEVTTKLRSAILHPLDAAITTKKRNDV